MKILTSWPVLLSVLLLNVTFAETPKDNDDGPLPKGSRIVAGNLNENEFFIVNNENVEKLKVAIQARDKAESAIKSVTSNVKLSSAEKEIMLQAINRHRTLFVLRPKVTESQNNVAAYPLSHHASKSIELKKPERRSGTIINFADLVKSNHAKNLFYDLENALDHQYMKQIQLKKLAHQDRRDTAHKIKAALQQRSRRIAGTPKGNAVNIKNVALTSRYPIKRFETFEVSRKYNNEVRFK